MKVRDERHEKATMHIALACKALGTRLPIASNAEHDKPQNKHNRWHELVDETADTFVGPKPTKKLQE